eukprot:1159242-Pelagomonas_calceolata.AAC.3
MLIYINQANPAQRLGVVGGGIRQLKAHPWFNDTNSTKRHPSCMNKEKGRSTFRGSGYSWDAMLAKRYQAPHLPNVSSPTDSSNFGDFSDLGNMVHEFELTPEQQAAFVCF